MVGQISHLSPSKCLTHAHPSWASLLVIIIVAPLRSHHFIAWVCHLEFACWAPQHLTLLVVWFPEAIMSDDAWPYDRVVTINIPKLSTHTSNSQAGLFLVITIVPLRSHCFLVCPTYRVRIPDSLTSRTIDYTIPRNDYIRWHLIMWLGHHNSPGIVQMHWSAQRNHSWNIQNPSVKNYYYL